jgi:hypothetical protein
LQDITGSQKKDHQTIKNQITILKMKTENNENDNIDNWMPKTSKKELALAIILSPFICLTAWLWLIVICAIEGK